MKKIFLTLIIVIFGLSSYAQDNYFYYYKDQKIALTPDYNLLNITVGEQYDTSKITQLGLKNEGYVSPATKESAAIVKLRFNSTPSEAQYNEVINALRQVNGIRNVSPYIVRGNGAEPIGMSNIFYVKLKNESDNALLQELASRNNISVVRSIPNMPLWHILSVNAGSSDNSLNAANRLYETSYFAAIDPAFMFNFGKRCTNDPDFGSLWGLDNTANPNYDINACQAWTLTEGAGANAAVLDQGIDVTHNDLSANISNPGFDTATNTPPSVFAGSSHGTHVAGTIAAIKDNFLQVVGVAPQAGIIPVSNELWVTPTISAELASGMAWAWSNGADVINNSWGDQGGAYYANLYSPALENAIDDALTLGRGGLGTLVVFAAGNWAPAMDYPGTYTDNITTVGSITSTGLRSSFSGYGAGLDVVAPGSNVLSTTPYNNTGYMSGTSMASPHVTGTICLIISANPCLSGAGVRNILESTCQKMSSYSYATTNGRPNGTWNNETGYGLIDAYAAVQLALTMTSPTLDLIVKDSQSPLDIGLEPNTITPYFWASQDIWVRVFGDGGLIHENPDYSPASNPNTVYVKIKNNSCVASTGSEQVYLHWAKAGTSLAWPSSWDGTTFLAGQSMGDLADIKPIPALLPGEEAIVPLDWIVPNPANYNVITPEPWHFCLLARIVTPNDPMTFTETSDLNGNVMKNNNIAWKNVTVVDAIANNAIGGVIGVGNPQPYKRSYKMKFIAEPNEQGITVFDEGRITFKMNEVVKKAWLAGGSQMEGLLYNQELDQFTLKSPVAELPNLHFGPNQLGVIDVKFTLRANGHARNYTFNIVQRDFETQRPIGGETYTINRIAGDGGEDGTQPDVPVAADEVNYITAISPNPTSGDVLVQYSLASVSNASIQVVGIYGATNTVLTYDLDTKASEFSFSLSGLPTGMYSVMLVCDGKVTSTKNLIKK